MCNLKPIEYFLEEEHQYIEMRKDNQDLCFLPDFGIVPSNIDDPLSFLEQNLFHKVYPTIHDLREKLNTSGLKFTDAELLMLLSFEGFISQYFRNDYWGKHETYNCSRNAIMSLFFDSKISYIYGNYIISFLRF